MLRSAGSPKGELPRLYNMRAPKIGARGSWLPKTHGNYSAAPAEEFREQIFSRRAGSKPARRPKKMKSLKARPKHKQQPLKFALPTDTRKITTLRACSPLQSFTARTKRKLRYRCLHAPQARIFTHIYSDDYIFKTNCDVRFYASGTKKF